jgi:hypothetical protein
LFSKKNLPFSYYSLKFCQPEPKILATESIGEVIFGDRIENSLFNVNSKRKLNFKIKMKENVKCQYVKDYVDPNCSNPEKQKCSPTKAKCFELTEKDTKEFTSKILENYEIQL